MVTTRAPKPPERDTGRDTTAAPIVILTYANAGGARLSGMLAESDELACTSGTGLLPLCGQALSTWRLVEGGRSSPLAVATVRRMATGMINALLVRSGASRWCETAVAQVDTADAFARVYPEARFVCLHRGADDVIRAVLRGGGWGATGPAFAPYVSAHPASPVAAVAAYWAAHAGPLLEFQQAHPEMCRRVMYEDVAARSDTMRRDLAGFLRLRPPPALPALPGDTGDAEDTSDHAAPIAPAPDAVPVRQIPAPLLAEVNRLHIALGYPELTDGT